MNSVQHVVHGHKTLLGARGEHDEGSVGNGGGANDDGVEGREGGGLVLPILRSWLPTVSRVLAMAKERADA